MQSSSLVPAKPYCTSDKTSFAYISAKDRWPIILTGAIDDLHRAVGSCRDEDVDEIKEGKAIIESLAKLKYELQHNRQMTPLEEERRGMGKDIPDYNQQLADLGNPTWFDVPWLYAECYLYRRIRTFFASTTHWRYYDVFARQKLSTFSSSRPAVLELAARYKELITQLQRPKHSTTDEKINEEAERLIFTEMCEISLWGNATDLSLLTTLSYDDIQKLQGSEARKKAESNILVNDLPAAYDVLKEAQREGREIRRVEIILDNAGFELYVDLILAGYLIAADLATEVAIHPKDIPWFVSDVTQADIDSLFKALEDPQRFFSRAELAQSQEMPKPLTTKEMADLYFLYQDWQRIRFEGQLRTHSNDFWTAAQSCWDLPKGNFGANRCLLKAELAIFKGDLNYRKLTADAMWDPTTAFSTAIGPLGKGSGVRTLALRTCKADVIVGLSEGEDERLKAQEGGSGENGERKWAWSGKFAVVQFCDGKV